MLPFREMDLTFHETAQALLAATGSAAAFSLCRDDNPFRLPWVRGRQWRLLGAPAGAFPVGLAVVVRLRAKETVWQFHDRFHETMVGLLNRRLPHGCASRIVYEYVTPQGMRRVTPARLGTARLGDGLLRTQSLKGGTMQEPNSDSSLLEELCGRVLRLVENLFSVKVEDRHRNQFEKELADCLARLPYRTGDVIDVDTFQRLEAMIAAVNARVDRLATAQRTGKYPYTT